MSTNFVVQLENRPGSLARLARAFADVGINIGEVSGAFGYAIFAMEGGEAARAVLRANSYVFIEGEVLIVDVPDRTGGLAEVTGRLADAGVNILAILFLGRSIGVVQTALTVDDIDAARLALAKA